MVDPWVLVATHSSFGLVLGEADHYLTDAWSAEKAHSEYEQRSAKKDRVVDDPMVTKVLGDVQAAWRAVQTDAAPT